MRIPAATSRAHIRVMALPSPNKKAHLSLPRRAHRWALSNRLSSMIRSYRVCPNSLSHVRTPSQHPETSSPGEHAINSCLSLLAANALFRGPVSDDKPDDSDAKQKNQCAGHVLISSLPKPVRDMGVDGDQYKPYRSVQKSSLWIGQRSVNEHSDRDHGEVNEPLGDFLPPSHRSSLPMAQKSGPGRIK